MLIVPELAVALRQELRETLCLYEREAARTTIGGDFADAADMEGLGQLWLFDSVALQASVRLRFALLTGARLLGRILLPAPVSETAGTAGTAMGFLFRSAPVPASRDGIPFL